jgi:hypothetical protein
MLGQCLFQNLAVAIVVLDCANLGDATEALKGAQVGLVYMGKVGVGDDNVGQGLDIAQTVGKSRMLEMQARVHFQGQYLVGSSRRQ